MIRRVLLAGAAVCCAAALTACSGSTKPGRTVTKFVDPSSPSGSSAPPSGSAEPSTAVSLPPAPKSMTKLSGQCDGKLPVNVVAPAIGESFGGQTAFVVGKADPGIHRVSYINCKYGLPDQNATPIVEIQVSLYGTAGQAAARIAPTVTDYENNGATARSTTVGDAPARILTGGTGAGYDTATLIMAYGQRTVAVSLSDDIPADKQGADLAKLAAIALTRTQ